MQRSILSLAAVAALGTSAYAAPATWDWYYDADVTPGTGGSIDSPQGTDQSSMSVVYGSPTQSISPAGIFNSSTIDSEGGGAYWYSTNTALATLNADTGYTIEWRMKINTIDHDAVGTGSLGTTFEDGRAGTMVWYNLGFDVTGGGQYVGQLLGANVGNALNFNTDNTAFHTYRITVLGTTATLYMDGALVGSINDPRALETNELTFGDGTGANDSDYSVDYYYVTDDGAFPIPEPASLSLLALGAVALMRRRA